MDDLLTRAHELAARGEPFALATVVRVERPASARPGMKAIVRADGTLEGWVGGSCAHPIVIRESLVRLREGTPRLISLSPEETDRAEQEGVIHHTMTCHSGGSLEIYIEPVLPRPQLLLIGEAPLVRALARLGRLAGFAVCVADAGGEAGHRGQADDLEADLRLPLEGLKSTISSDTYAVVATMGDYDEEALEDLVGTGAGYVGLVASRKRAEAVFAHLVSRGLGAEHVHRVKVPAGLDIGAVTPEEIAVSIMAEIIQVRRSRTPGVKEVPRQEMATDPICGMTVAIATATHTVDHQGVRVYFCSAHCRHTFEREPARYVTAGP
ncbi:MAG: XdhC family protein [Armatimonadetes bacterium]|nr:XdhC family protein [Armatimonadota bacterium]